LCVPSLAEVAFGIVTITHLFALNLISERVGERSESGEGSARKP